MIVSGVQMLIGVVLIFTDHLYGLIFTSIGLLILPVARFIPRGPFSKPPSYW